MCPCPLLQKQLCPSEATCAHPSGDSPGAWQDLAARPGQALRVLAECLASPSVWADRVRLKSVITGGSLMNAVGVPEARGKLLCPLSSHFVAVVCTAAFGVSCATKLSMCGNLIED